MSKHFSELTFEIIQMHNQDDYEWNRSIVDMQVQTSPDTEEQVCGDDVETGTYQAWIQPAYMFSPMMQAQQICSVDKMQ